MLIKNGLVFTEENIFLPLTIQTNGELITSLTASHSSTESPAPEETVIDASGCYVIPGLTDIHFHGCNGYDFCDNNLEAYKSISEFCLSNGVTSICPATMTLPVSELKSICETAVSFYQVQQQKATTIQNTVLLPLQEGRMRQKFWNV